MSSIVHFSLGLWVSGGVYIVPTFFHFLSLPYLGMDFFWHYRLANAVLYANRRWLPLSEETNDNWTREDLTSRVTKRARIFSKQHGRSRRFCAIKNEVSSIKSFLKAMWEKEKGFCGLYEVIMGCEYRPLYFDIDHTREQWGSVKRWLNLGDETDLRYLDFYTQCLLTVLHWALDWMNREGVNTWPDVDTEREMSLTSRFYALRETKVSLHIHSKVYGAPDGPSMKKFILAFWQYIQTYKEELLTHLKTRFPFLNNAVIREGFDIWNVLFDRVPYSVSAQNWRIPYAYKAGSHDSVLLDTENILANIKRQPLMCRRIALNSLLAKKTTPRILNPYFETPEIHERIPRRVQTVGMRQHNANPLLRQVLSTFLNVRFNELVVEDRPIIGGNQNYSANLTLAAVRTGKRFPCPMERGRHHITNGCRIIIKPGGAIYVKCWNPNCWQKSDVPVYVSNLYTADQFQVDQSQESPHVQHFPLDARYIGDDQETLTTLKEMALGERKSFLGITSPPGTGKTTAVKKLIEYGKEGESNMKFIILVPRRSLALDISKRLGIPNHIETKGRNIAIKGAFVTCPNSLTRIDHTIYRGDDMGHPPSDYVVIIDELLTFINLIVSPVISGKALARTFEVLKNASSIIGLEAFWDERCDVFLGNVGGERRGYVVSNAVTPPFSRDVETHTDLAKFETKFQEVLLTSNSKVFVCCKHVASAEVMERLAAAVGVQAIVHTSKAGECPRDVEKLWKFQKCVIVTSQVGVGVDYSDGPAFTDTFLVAFEGLGADANALMQMALRTRVSLNRKIYAFLPTTRKKPLCISEDELNIDLSKHIKVVTNELHYPIHCEKDLEIVENQKILMRRLYCMCKVAENKSLNNLRKELCGVAGKHFTSFRYSGDEASRESEYMNIEKELRSKKLEDRHLSVWQAWRLLKNVPEYAQYVDLTCVGKMDYLKIAWAAKKILSYMNASYETFAPNHEPTALEKHYIELYHASRDPNETQEENRTDPNEVTLEDVRVLEIPDEICDADALLSHGILRPAMPKTRVLNPRAIRFCLARICRELGLNGKKMRRRNWFVVTGVVQAWNAQIERTDLIQDMAPGPPGVVPEDIEPRSEVYEQQPEIDLDPDDRRWFHDLETDSLNAQAPLSQGDIDSFLDEVLH